MLILKCNWCSKALDFSYAQYNHETFCGRKCLNKYIEDERFLQELEEKQQMHYQQRCIDDFEALYRN